MYLIERLWIDDLENKNAYGFIPIGYVKTLQEAEYICNLQHIPKKEYPWPLNYAHEFKGDTVPVFRMKEITDLTGKTLGQIKGDKYV